MQIAEFMSEVMFLEQSGVGCSQARSVRKGFQHREARGSCSPVSSPEQTTDEMCIAFLHYTLDREHHAGRVAQR